AADTLPTGGRQRLPALEFRPLDFDPPRVEERTVAGGIPVLFLEDRSLPLVDFMVRFEGGYAHFDREQYAVATAMPTLVRTGGTRSLSPDSVDLLLEYYALQTTFGSGGESASGAVNTLAENVEEAVALWAEMMRAPRFDTSQIEIWRGRTLESIRRRNDNPGSMAFSRFNRLMFGDHPTGWEMTEADVDPEHLTPERFRWLHERIYCKQNMAFGVSGAISWDRAEALLEEALADWPDCPTPLPEEDTSPPRDSAGLFLIPRESLSQSVVVMAEPGGVTREDQDAYHAATIANSILGGSGFNSRLMSRIRTEEGLAYSVSSLWTTPTNGEGIVGAVAQTRADATNRTVHLILEEMRRMIREEPAAEEVQLAIDQIANGFVFNFQSPAQIVARQLLYRARELPMDWLEQYVDGIQRVQPGDVHRVVAENLDPENMTILIVGDTTAFDPSPEALGLPPGTVDTVQILGPGP
ncbi:MAG: pitrilysin family protein, partial [Longimicrobiales bacterium]|nr:pitrilysin family protein [Longimicrobiales bacterium]